MLGWEIPARWLEECLIVVPPNRIDAEKSGRDFSESPRENNFSRGIAHPPDVRDLREQLRVVVDPSLRLALVPIDDGSDHAAISRNLLARSDSADVHVSVASECFGFDVQVLTAAATLPRSSSSIA